MVIISKPTSTTQASIKVAGMVAEQRTLSGPILVIENSWHDLVLMTHVLDDLNLKGRVIAVHNGMAALDRITEIEEGKVEQPAAIIVDLCLPDIPGEQLVAEIRQRQSLQNTPVVLFSDAPLEELARISQRFSLQGYCQKPAGFAEFQQCFSQLLLRWVYGEGKQKSAEGIA